MLSLDVIYLYDILNWGLFGKMDCVLSLGCVCVVKVDELVIVLLCEVGWFVDK